MKSEYILMDFSCGRFYTHHSSYIKDYADYLIDNNYNVKICVNDSADNEVITLFRGYDFFANLKSNNYGMTKNKNFSRFVQDKIIQLFFQLLEKFFFPVATLEYFRKKIASNYVNSAIKFLEEESLQLKPITLVFPTTDSLSFRLIEKLALAEAPSVNRVCARITGAEKRGVFGVNDSEFRLANLSKSNHFELNIGLETNIYFKKFSKLNPDFKKSLVWAPMPFINRKTKKISLPSNAFKIGFLGSARKGKGFEHIPSILRTLNQSKLDFQAFIQLPIFEWKNSKKVVEEIDLEFDSRIIWLDGGISRKDIEINIGNLDCIFLPYDTTAYKFAGSGILFLAADLGIPIITNENVAFAWDIEFFKIGITYLEFNELPNKIKEIESKCYIKNFENYNKVRDKANKIFLNL
jgi:hypothetical protein